MFVEVHEGHDENRFFPDLVNDPVRKSACAATTRTRRERRPCLRVLNDPSERPFDLGREFISQTFALQVIVGYGGDEFSPCRLKEVDIHEDFRLSILSKTLLAEVALIFL